jgi:NitT/TauT family transport system ATP-binding protein
MLIEAQPLKHNEMTRPPLLRLDRISKSFGERQILRDFSLDLPESGILTLLGPSGCGKTTLLRLVAALEQPDQGTIIRAPSLEMRGAIGYVFQDATLMPWASAQANIALPLILQGLSRAEAKARAQAMLERVNLLSFADAAPHELSGGMKMRVALARALITAPKLILMDEPFAALDEMTRHALNDEMLRLVRDTDLSVLFVTHSVAEAAYLSDRVLVLSQRPARIIADHTLAWPSARHAGLRHEARFMEISAQLSAALGRAMDDSVTADAS